LRFLVHVLPHLLLQAPAPCAAIATIACRNPTEDDEN
jgi:hypothetical protein